MKKALMIIAIVGIVVIAGSTVYYYVFVKAESERADIRLKEQKFELEKQKFELDLEIQKYEALLKVLTDEELTREIKEARERLSKR